MKAIVRIHLAKMPYDKFTSGGSFVHSTGDEVKLEDGSWWVEYEDSIYEDADDCIYYDESEDD